MIEYLSTLSGVDLAFYLFLTFMSILAVIATAVSCWPVRRTQCACTSCPVRAQAAARSHPGHF